MSIETDLFDLTGQVAVITGSSKGIGKAIAEQMALHGAKVVISSRKAEICEAVVSEINAKALSIIPRQNCLLTSLKRSPEERYEVLFMEIALGVMFPGVRSGRLRKNRGSRFRAEESERFSGKSLLSRESLGALR